jgi:hypothetical protein
MIGGPITSTYPMREEHPLAFSRQIVCGGWLATVSHFYEVRLHGAQPIAGGFSHAGIPFVEYTLEH